MKALNFLTKKIRRQYPAQHQNLKGKESFTNKPVNERSTRKPSEKDTAPEWDTGRSMTGDRPRRRVKEWRLYFNNMPGVMVPGVSWFAQGAVQLYVIPDLIRNPGMHGRQAAIDGGPPDHIQERTGLN